MITILPTSLLAFSLLGGLFMTRSWAEKNGIIQPENYPYRHEQPFSLTYVKYLIDKPWLQQAELVYRAVKDAYLAKSEEQPAKVEALYHKLTKVIRKKLPPEQQSKDIEEAIRECLK